MTKDELLDLINESTDDVDPRSWTTVRRNEPLIKAELTALYADRAEVERVRAHWSETEARSADAHAAYQVEAHRRGDVRHSDNYAYLSESTKEWDRVLVRWVQSTLKPEAFRE